MDDPEVYQSLHKSESYICVSEVTLKDKLQEQVDNVHTEAGSLPDQWFMKLVLVFNYHILNVFQHFCHIFWHFLIIRQRKDVIEGFISH